MNWVCGVGAESRQRGRPFQNPDLHSFQSLFFRGLPQSTFIHVPTDCSKARTGHSKGVSGVLLFAVMISLRDGSEDVLVLACVDLVFFPDLVSAWLERVRSPRDLLKARDWWEGGVLKAHGSSEPCGRSGVQSCLLP